MLVKEGTLWKGKDWQELGVEFRGNKEHATTDVKVKCPACPELGKTHLNDTPLSVVPAEGKGHCWKCGTVFIIDKDERPANIESHQKFKPVVPTNTTNLSDDGMAFFRSRRLLQETVKRHRIAQRGSDVAFPFFKDGVLMNVKYRGIKEKKFSQTAGGTHIVYNYDNAKKALDDNLTKAVVITEGECYTGDTEVLTESGWVQLDQYLGQNVLQINHDKSGDFVKPLAVIKKNYDGKLINYSSGSYKMLTTPNHTFVRVIKGKYVKRAATESTHFPIPRTTTHDGCGVDLSDDQIKLMVACSADFSFRSGGDIYGAFKKEKKIIRARTILDSIGLRYSSKIEASRGYINFYIYRGQDTLYLTKEFNHSLLSELDLRQKRLFLNELLHWDGNPVPDRNQIEYSSCLYSNATFVQTLAHLCGYTSTIIRRSNEFGKWFKVSILFGKQTSSTQGGWTEVDYSGLVYCLTVPSGMILVRHMESISVCGNCDTMSFDEAGFPAAVSLDGGAPNPNDRVIDGKFECIDNSYELFDAAETIYIAVDNDVNGKIAEKELVRRFGAEKVRLVDFGKYKDANEVLLWESREYLQKLVETAKEIKVAGVFRLEDSYDDLVEMFTNGLTKGSSTYMPSIDKAWKWRAGEVNLWTGYNNEGKSTLLRYLELLKARFDGWKFGLFVPEDMPLAEFMEGLVHMYCGRPTDPDAPIKATADQIKEAMEFINEHFFVVYPEEDFTLETLFEKFKYLIRRHGVRAVDIDPYNQVEHLYGKSQREDLYISEFMGKVKRFALQNGVAVNVVAHQVKPDKKNADGTYPPPSKYSIKGGGTFSDKADNVLVVWRPRRQVDKADRTTTFISEKIKKPKLVGEIDLNVDIEYDYFQNRYLDITLGKKSPLEFPLAFNTTR